MTIIIITHRITLACWDLASAMRGVFMARAIVAKDKIPSSDIRLIRFTKQKEGLLRLTDGGNDLAF